MQKKRKRPKFGPLSPEKNVERFLDDYYIRLGMLNRRLNDLYPESYSWRPEDELEHIWRGKA